MESMWKVDLYQTPVYVQNIIIEKNVNVKLYHESKGIGRIETTAASINTLRYS